MQYEQPLVSSKCKVFSEKPVRHNKEEIGTKYRDVNNKSVDIHVINELITTTLY